MVVNGILSYTGTLEIILSCVPKAARITYGADILNDTQLDVQMLSSGM